MLATRDALHDNVSGPTRKSGLTTKVKSHDQTLVAMHRVDSPFIRIINDTASRLLL